MPSCQDLIARSVDANLNRISALPHTGVYSVCKSYCISAKWALWGHGLWQPEIELVYSELEKRTAHRDLSKG